MVALADHKNGGMCKAWHSASFCIGSLGELGFAGVSGVIHLFVDGFVCGLVLLDVRWYVGLVNFGVVEFCIFGVGSMNMALLRSVVCRAVKRV